MCLRPEEPQVCEQSPPIWERSWGRFSLTDPEGSCPADPLTLGFWPGPERMNFCCLIHLVWGASLLQPRETRHLGCREEVEAAQGSPFSTSLPLLHLPQAPCAAVHEA